MEGMREIMEETIKQELKKFLSEKRYIHSLGVMKRAGELAQIYKVSIKNARLAGLLHDIAKEMPDKEKIRYCQQNQLEIDTVERNNPSLLHAKIGADIAKKQYHFSPSMQKAILYHTTGAPEMDMLAKIIFIADKTEENRKFRGVTELRRLSEQNIHAAMLETMNFTILKYLQKNEMIHPASVRARNWLLAEKF